MALVPVCAYLASMCVPSLASGMYSPSVVFSGELCTDWPADASLLRYGLACRGGAYALALAAAAGATISVAALVGMGSRTSGHIKAGSPSGPTSPQLQQPLLETGGLSAGSLSVMTGRPDLRGEISRAAGGSDASLSVRACGPRQLLSAVHDAVSAARSAGQHVHLQVEESEW
mmetsp:Transcript_115986/g.352696  ORF Transcript_115986/g.352696 Transcript_115986/m.352696 type:complete len:173 (+) Transcript_115986:2-520(+)